MDAATRSDTFTEYEMVAAMRSELLSKSQIDAATRSKYFIVRKILLLRAAAFYECYYRSCCGLEGLAKYRRED
jgi:hypothetical protein